MPGLPEQLPAGEQILWQGSPHARTLAWEAFHLRKLAFYFAIIGALRLGFLMEDGLGAMALAKAMAPFLILAIGGLAIVASLAWLSARHTLYTLTNRRVVMRIGIVLTVTFNLPYSRISGANLRNATNGHGDVALEIDTGSRIPWLQLWPHARPWHVRHPQPTLRAIEAPARVAQLLTQAWSETRGRPARAADDAASRQNPLGRIGAPAH